MFKHVLLPTDGSPLSEAAIRKGIQFAKMAGAKITGFYAKPDFHTLTLDAEMLEDTQAEFEKNSRTRAEKYLSQIERAATEEGVSCQTLSVVSDQPHEAIIAAANTNACDLIVMASHGRSGLKGILLGSVTQKVLTHTVLPVLVIR